MSLTTNRQRERVRVDDAAAILGISARTVQALAARGEIPGAAKICSIWTFDIATLNRFQHKFKKRNEKKPAPPKEKVDKVYVVQCGSCIKIGFTSNLAQRLHALKTSNAQEVELIGSFPGTRADEKKLHQQFAHLRANGEWFHAETEIRSWILKTLGVRITRYGSFNESFRAPRLPKSLQPRGSTRHVGKHG